MIGFPFGAGWKMATPKIVTAALWLAVCFLYLQPLCAQQNSIVWTAQEQPIVGQIKGLRQLPDDQRATETRDLALAIRRLSASPNKLRLANALANLSTEGDFGHETLQEVATTLAAALAEQPQSDRNGQPAMPYVELAQLVRYEHVEASSDSPQCAAAMAKLTADDQQRDHADFTLTDLNGNAWTLQSLRGKVVLVNFWATWCPPCRKEMPDLEDLYRKFKNQGLVVLGISDEDKSKVEAFVAEHHTSYPILLDPGRRVNTIFQVEGIPKTFIYNREGKLAAEAIDMRTRKQFLALLAQAGVQ